MFFIKKKNLILTFILFLLLGTVFCLFESTNQSYAYAERTILGEGSYPKFCDGDPFDEDTIFKTAEEGLAEDFQIETVDSQYNFSDLSTPTYPFIPIVSGFNDVAKTYYYNFHNDFREKITDHNGDSYYSYDGSGYYVITRDSNDYTKFLNAVYSGAFNYRYNFGAIGQDLGPTEFYPFLRCRTLVADILDYVVGSDTDWYSLPKGFNDLCDELQLSNDIKIVGVDSNGSYEEAISRLSKGTYYVFYVNIRKVAVCYGSDQYYYYFGMVVRNISSTYETIYQDTLSSNFENQLENGTSLCLTDSRRATLQSLLGIYRDGVNVPLYINGYDYEFYFDGKPSGKIVYKRLLQKDLSSLYIQDKEYIRNYVNKNLGAGGIYLSHFDVGVEKTFDDTIPKTYYLIDDYTWLECDNFDYVYSGSNYGEVNLEYLKLGHRDITIELYSNDSENSNMKLYLRSNDNDSPDAQVGYVDFTFGDIVSKAYSQFGWLIDTIDIDTLRDSFQGGEYFQEGVEQNGFYYEFIVDSDDTQPCVRVHYDKSNQDALINGHMSLGVKIVPNYFYDVKVIYKDFNFDINGFKLNHTVKTDEIKNTIRYDALSYLFAGDNHGWDNFLNGQEIFYFPSYRTKIENGIPTILAEKGILAYAGITNSLPIKNDERYEGRLEAQKLLAENHEPLTESVGEYVITVHYAFSPCYYVNYRTKTNSQITSDFDILICDNSSQEVYGSYFTKNLVIPKTHRLESIEIDKEYILTDKEHIRIDYNNPNNNKFSLIGDLWLDSTNPTVVPVVVNVSDEMLVNFEYYRRYYDSNNIPTPFAVVQKVSNLKVKVADFKNIEKPTSYELSSVLKKDVKYKGLFEDRLAFMGEAGVRPADELITSFCNQNGVFNYTVPYGTRSVFCKNPDGDFSATEVYLMPYSVWVDGFDSSWEVDMLNYEGDHKWRLSNADFPDKSKLYGLFTSFVSKTEINDLSAWFNGLSELNRGCVVAFTSKEVKGSGFYKFITENSSFFGVVGGGVGMIAGCSIGGPLGALAGTGLGVALTNFLMPSVCEFINEDNGTFYTHFFYLDGSSLDPFFGFDGGIDEIGDWLKDNFPEFFKWLSENWKKIVAVILLIIFLPTVINLVSYVIGKVFKAGKNVTKNVSKGVKNGVKSIKKGNKKVDIQDITKDIKDNS